MKEYSKYFSDLSQKLKSNLALVKDFINKYKEMFNVRKIVKTVAISILVIGAIKYIPWGSVFKFSLKILKYPFMKHNTFLETIKTEQKEIFSTTFKIAKKVNPFSQGSLDLPKITPAVINSIQNIFKK